MGNSLTTTQLSQGVASALQLGLTMIELVALEGRIPRGTIYTAFMSKGCSLREYEGIEGLALQTGMIKRQGQELIWNGSSEDLAMIKGRNGNA